MRNFRDTSETCKRSFISAFLICMTVLKGQFADHKGYMHRKNRNGSRWKFFVCLEWKEETYVSLF